MEAFLRGSRQLVLKMVSTMKEFSHQRGGLPYTISQQTHHKRHRLKPTARALVRLLVVMAVVAGLLRWFDFFGPTTGSAQSKSSVSPNSRNFCLISCKRT